ncbi:LamG-like jellyroll fold domain-containing protein [Reichenbachiella ulvae]|uniref:Ig-like domain-containing protein n=1 Tax=Reichenbachiella ulvae TaxID=2980104 RepID=A0ABT3CVT0_9BACT|nr:LamG-like jellyroll fold domain-containing protein [Reichenbachiella ulvae]MCV9387600.1 Ig-like domain-containing protein [Reichenbachiella ulvae]
MKRDSYTLTQKEESCRPWGQQLSSFKRTLLGLCVVMLASMSSFAQNCNINTNVNGNGGTAWSGSGVGQSFTACATGKLNFVRPTAINNTVATAYVIIYSGEGFTNELGRTGNIQVGAGRTNQFDLSSLNIQVTSGQKYTARFMGWSGSPQFQYGTYAAADYYAGGRILGAGASNNDMFFSAQILSLGTPTLSPVHNATEVSKTSPILITFGANVEAGTGDVVVRNETDAVDLVTIPAADLIFDGGEVTIDHGQTFESGKQYSVSIASGAIVGTNGVSYTGISAANWTFTVTDRPGLTLSTSEGELTNNSPFQVTATFTAAVTGFELTDFTATNATVSNLSGSGDTYTVDVTPDADGAITLSVAENLAQDGGALLNTASNEIALTYDGTFNAPLVESSTPEPTYNALAEVTITVDEAVTGLEESDVVLTNATIRSFDITGMVATVSIVPSAEGSFGFDIAADAFTDLAGNGNAAISYTNTYEVDLTFGMTAYYPISDGVVEDYTGNNRDLSKYSSSTLPTAFEDRYSDAAGAMLFNGTDMWTTNLPNGSTIESYTYNDDNGGVSASIWVKPETDLTSATSGIRTFFETYGGSQDLRLAYYSGSISIKVGSSIYNHSVSLFSDQWYHIAFSIQKSGAVILYLDGTAYELATTGPASMPESSSDMIMFGSTIVGGYGSIISPANAALDDFMMYNRVLSAVEMGYLNSNYPKLEQLAICDGETIAINGTDYTTAGFYPYSKAGTSVDSLIFANLTVNGAPSVFASASSLQICEGESVTLTGHGAVSYAWDNDVVDGVSFVPTADATYTVTGTDENGCTADASVSVTLSTTTLEEVTLTAGQTDFCQADAAGTTITTSGSVTGFDYYLLNADTGDEIAGPIAGTGSPLVFQTGELNEDITYEVYAEEPVSGTSGSLEFDGTNDRLTIPFDSASMAISNEFTIETWIYPEGTSSRRIFSNFSGTGYAAVGSIVFDLVNAETGVHDGDDLRLYVRKDVNTPEYISAGDVLTLNAWNHVAATFKDGVASIYVDGELVANGTFTATSVVYNSSVWGIGEDYSTNNDNAEFFDGKMDEFRVWRYARTQDELKSTMNKGLAGTEDRLAVYFKFDDGTDATIAADASGNGNDATLVSMNPATVWVDGLIGSNLSCSRTMQQTVALTVGDSEAPSILTQDITVQLTAEGSVAITTADIDNGSSDNCTATESLAMSLDITSFTCDQLGENTVTLTVTDEAGNSADATAVVTVTSYVEDRTVTAMDTETCQGGSAAIAVATSQIGVNYYLVNNDAGTDVLGPVAGTGNDIVFTAENITATTNYSVRASLAAGTASCDLTLSNVVTVTVGADTSAPTLVLTDLALDLDANGAASIALADVLSSVSDNCTVEESLVMTLDVTGFGCDNLGANTVTVTATDESGNVATETATITISDNTDPVVLVQDIVVVLDETNNATISVTDIDNGSSDNCSIASMTLDVTSFTEANLGDNTVTLTVTDAAGNVVTATANVNVSPNNQVPVVQVEPGDITIDEDTQMNGVNITGYFSDPDGDALTYSATSDVSAVALTLTEGILDIVPDANYNGSATITLTAEDTKGATASTSFLLTVTPVNDAPVANYASEGLVATEGQVFDFSENPGLMFSDVDGDDLTYTVDLGAAASWLSQSVTATNITLSGTPTFTDGGNVVILTITATDGVFEASVTLQLTVQNVNQAPTDLSLSATSVLENAAIGTVVATISTTDADVDDSFTYSLVASSGDVVALGQDEIIVEVDNALPFVISGDQIVTNAELDFETRSSYDVELTVSDAAGDSYTESFTLTVENVAEAPVAISLSNNTIAENNALQEVIGELSVEDPDQGETYTYSVSVISEAIEVGLRQAEGGAFAISGSQLVANEVYNFESQSNYSIEITVNDGNGNNFTESFTIQITDQNDAPFGLALSANVVQDGAQAGALVGTLSASDEDGEEVLTFSESSDMFEIDGTDLILSQAVDLSTMEGNVLSVEVTATDASGASITETFEITIEAEEVLSAKDEATPSIKLYPNPTTTRLMIEGYAKDYSQYQIIGLDGQILDAGVLIDGGSSIPVSGLKSGVYLIRLQGESLRSFTTRFMKQ